MELNEKQETKKNDAQAEAYLLASNRLVELGGWDEGELEKVLKDLAKKDALEGSGYDGDDLDELIADAAKEDEPRIGKRGAHTCPECGCEFN